MARLDGDGSYRKLITDIYGIKRQGDSVTQSYKEYGNNIKINNIFIITPLSYLLTGNYNRSSGNKSNQKIYILMWGKKAYYKEENGNLGQYLYIAERHIRTSGYYDYRGQGYSIRCVAKSLF